MSRLIRVKSCLRLLLHHHYHMDTSNQVLHIVKYLILHFFCLRTRLCLGLPLVLLLLFYCQYYPSGTSHREVPDPTSNQYHHQHFPCYQLLLLPLLLLLLLLRLLRQVIRVKMRKLAWHWLTFMAKDITKIKLCTRRCSMRRGERVGNASITDIRNLTCMGITWPTTYYLLPTTTTTTTTTTSATYYLLHTTTTNTTTYYLLPTTYYLLPTTYYLLPTILLPININAYYLDSAWK